MSVPSQALAHSSRGGGPALGQSMNRQPAPAADLPALRMPRTNQSDQRSRAQASPSPSPQAPPAKTPDFNPLVIRREA